MMKLRSRQVEFVKNCMLTLNKKKICLGVAPCGFGKTIIFIFIACEYVKLKKKVLIIVNRVTLLQQTVDKLKTINPNLKYSIFNQENKDFQGDVVVAMQQSLLKNEKLATFDLIILDEAHRALSEGYKSLISKFKENNTDSHILGLTATPKTPKGNLLDQFENLADEVNILELIDEKLLVKPEIYCINTTATKELEKVKKTSSDYDHREVAKLLNTRVVNSEILRHYKKGLANRKAVAFCSSIEHAEDMYKYFKQSNIKCGLIHSKMLDSEIEGILESYKNGYLNLIFNVGILCEGIDVPEIDAIILLRQSSFVSVILQMIGRGLRLSPGKKDCIVFDFGVSIKKNPDLFILNWEKLKSEKIPEFYICENCGNLFFDIKICPKCGKEVYNVSKVKESKLKIDLNDIVLEKAYIKTAPTKRVEKNLWVKLGKDLYILYTNKTFLKINQKFQLSLMKSVDDEIIVTDIGVFDDLAIAKTTGYKILKDEETSNEINKFRRMYNEHATYKQLNFLKKLYGRSIKCNKYQATCLISYKLKVVNYLKKSSIYKSP